ncbi:MAG TPA: LamG-like jellyroll fold domain-containing protein [Candidatus Microsaccharimonas sp.]|jgi:prepilin-type N-terminal cleavage/methylation domain-containing protein
MKFSLKHLKSGGFTIIELLVVIVVIGILAAISIITYNGVQKGAIDKTVQSDVDGVASEVSRYGVNNSGNYGSSVAWYSGGSVNTNIVFTPSPGNVIDVVTNKGLYCIRGYNPKASTAKSLVSSYIVGSTSDACTVLSPSVAAGGSGDASLVDWWKLNGDAMDSSGSGDNGAINGAVPAIGATGVANTAYSFVASTAPQNIITPASSSSSGPITYSAWVKPSALPVDKSTIIESMSPYGNYMSLNSDSSLVLYRYNTTPAGYHSSGAGTIVLNQWNLTTVTWDGTNAKLYINGALTNTVAVTGVGLVSSTVLIGAESAARQFVGSIDDVRIYNRALSNTEITALFSAGAK